MVYQMRTEEVLEGYTRCRSATRRDMDSPSEEDAGSWEVGAASLEAGGASDEGAGSAVVAAASEDAAS